MWHRDSVKVTTGLKQEDSLFSILLFNLPLKKVIREMNVHDRIILGNSNINLLVYIIGNIRKYLRGKIILRETLNNHGKSRIISMMKKRIIRQ